jgi:hypothetical protein
MEAGSGSLLNQLLCVRQVVDLISRWFDKIFLAVLDQFYIPAVPPGPTGIAAPSLPPPKQGEGLELGLDGDRRKVEEGTSW